MMDLERFEIIAGHDGIERLKASSVALIGVGGVGGFTAECLARCGVGRIALCDGDVVEPTNINRQLVAAQSTMGENKVAVMARRIQDINPDVQVEIYDQFWTRDTDFILQGAFDYVIDAIDSFREKMDLIELCRRNEIPIISAMGAGLRLDGSAFTVTDIFKTFNDPMAKKVRVELRKRGIQSHDVVFSTEKPQKITSGPVGSAVFAVGASGLMLASYVIQKLWQAAL